MKSRLRSVSKFNMTLLVTLVFSGVTEALAERNELLTARGVAHVKKTFEPPSAVAHPVGLTEGLDRTFLPRIVVRDFNTLIDDPAVPGESVVLSTVGVEVEQFGEVHFHPLLSIAIDKTFEEAPGGQWLALWNLGHRRPEVGSFLAALVPGSIARRRADQSKLEKLQMRLDHFDTFYAHGSIGAPKPTYDITDGFRESYLRLLLNGTKIGFGFFSDSFWPQFLFRSYLLRRNDQLQRTFQQTYLGLCWYDDISASERSDLALSQKSVRDIKFRMLANRSSFGGWALPGEAEDFVLGYEHELREHLWVTSNRLAADANEFNLGFEEFHRFTANGVPLALGGVLYYDPELAPEPDQEKWSFSNPFDLTYNPFQDPEVLELAKDGRPVPLALYTYQSNMALKPIITVDFLRPNNPRLRQAATYWRRLGNEAIASASIFGLFYNGIRRALTFAANKKGLTWLSDNKVAMGIEELRLSLMSSLYFQSESGDQVLDRVDRLVVNPLIQPSREQRVRAQIQYRTLIAGGGEKVLQAVRKLREKQIGKVAGTSQNQLNDQAYEDYRGYLSQQNHLGLLRIFAEDTYFSSVPNKRIDESIAELGRTLRVEDRRSVQELADFFFRVSQRAPARSEKDRFQEVAHRTQAALEGIYSRSGKTAQELDADLAMLKFEYQRRDEKENKRRLKGAAIFFSRQLERHLKTLEAVVLNQGDPFVVSPWYVSRAALFAVEAPAAARANPWIAKKYHKKEKLLRQLLAEAYTHLEAYEPDHLNSWQTRERELALVALRSAQNSQSASLKANQPAESVAVSIDHQP